MQPVANLSGTDLAEIAVDVLDQMGEIDTLHARQTERDTMLVESLIPVMNVIMLVMVLVVVMIMVMVMRTPMAMLALVVMLALVAILVPILLRILMMMIPPDHPQIPIQPSFLHQAPDLRLQQRQLPRIEHLHLIILIHQLAQLRQQAIGICCGFRWCFLFVFFCLFVLFCLCFFF